MDLSQETPVQVRVSPSRISAYQDCPKKYHYIYEQNLQPVGPSKRHFDKGNYFHELSHVYYQLIQAGAEPGSDFVLANIRNRIQNDLGKAPGVELITIYAAITKTMTRFITEQSPKIDRGITVIGIEQELNQPVILPSGRTI